MSRVSLADLVPNSVHDGVQVVINLEVPEPHHSKTAPCQPGIPILIPGSVIRSSVLASIQLHNKPGRKAGKVHNVDAKRHLSPELHPPRFPSSQTDPQLDLMGCHRLSKGFGQLGILMRHAPPKPPFERSARDQCRANLDFTILALDGRGPAERGCGCAPEAQSRVSRPCGPHPFRAAAPPTFPIKGKDEEAFARASPDILALDGRGPAERGSGCAPKALSKVSRPCGPHPFRLASRATFPIKGKDEGLHPRKKPTRCAGFFESLFPLNRSRGL